MPSDEPEGRLPRLLHCRRFGILNPRFEPPLVKLSPSSPPSSSSLSDAPTRGGRTPTDLRFAIPALLLTGWLQAPALAAWWTRDDPCLLRSLEAHGALAHGTDPAVWQQLSTNVFMPWQLLSLGLDYQLFGLGPRGFYLHQLLAVGLVVLLAHRLLCRWMPGPVSGLAVWFFAASAPFYGVGQQLMNRHYLEGLGFSLAAMLLYRPDGLEGSSWRSPRNLASAGLYFCAAAAKEVFVPLPLLLFTLPPSRSLRPGWRVRLAMLGPHLTLSIVYLAWRTRMLGGEILTRYGGRPGLDDPSSLGDGLLRAGQALLPSVGWPSALYLLVLGVAVLRVVWRRPDRWPLISAIGLAVTLPWLGVYPDLEARHLLVVALAASIALALAIAEFEITPPRKVVGAGLAALAVAALALQAPLREQQAARVAHHRAEGEWMLRGQGAPLLTTLADASFLECLVDLRPRVASPMGPAPGYCGDPCWCGDQSSSWLAYDGVSELDESLTTVDCRMTGSTRPFEVSLERDPGTDYLRWQLGPWSTGEYSVLLDASGPTLSTDPEPAPAVSVPIPIPRQGGLRWPGDHEFVFRYRSPEGWTVYQPAVVGNEP